MENSDNSIYLHGTEYYITDTPDEAYLVRSGKALIYIVPWRDEKAGKRVLLCEAPQGAVIPGFAYKDQDYSHWRFMIAAAGETELSRMPPASSNSILRRKFAQRASLLNYEEEGFENSIIERYRHEDVSDDVFIERGKQQIPKAKSESFSVIKEAFEKEGTYFENDDQVYKAVAYACHKMGLPVPEYEKLSSICGEELSVRRAALASNLLCRDVVLDADWYHTDCGVLIAKMEDNIVVCIPKGQKYEYYIPSTGHQGKLTKELALTIDPKAVSLSKPLPSRKLTRKDLLQFGRRELAKSDLWAICILGVISTLIGVLLPMLNQKVYDDYIPLGNYAELTQICVVIGSFMIGNLFISIVKGLSEFRLQSRAGYSIQNAAYHRLFRLPESFFNKYESADLAQRLMSISGVINKYVESVVITGLTTTFSLLYLVRMFRYSSKLSWISILMVVVYTGLLIPLTVTTIKFERESAANKGIASSKLYQYLNGIDKIRMAGVEDRAIYDYLIPFSKTQSMDIRKSKLSAGVVVLTGISSTVFSMILYYVVVKTKIGISMGSFVGFNTALGAFTAAVQKQVENLLEVYNMRPIYERFMPIFETACEDDEDSELPGELSGDISISHVSFSYGQGQKLVLDDIDLTIRSGEYIGIVGTSGCGKSTLLKLLLGFEIPVSGTISYDGRNLAALDKQALRRNLGVVLQNGKLIAGSIFENITITAPEATLSEVQRVIEDVGLKDDIAQMPMGVHTVLSENSSTISGGQQQRILIARAIIRRPAILIFDEATSALDNLTQSTVSESLDRMKSTRIVVAHRLSTIKNCDRIIVLQDGHIAEEGDYSTLMQSRGLFYQLASRQLAD